MKLYLVEILRYADPGQPQLYGIFNKSKKEIFKIMGEYNDYRGGKYPAYRITEFKLDKKENFENNNKSEIVYVDKSYENDGTKCVPSKCPHFHKKSGMCGVKCKE